MSNTPHIFMGADCLHASAECYLAERYPGSLIVHEFSIGNWGSALIDVVAITPEAEIIGVEVKGDGDSPSRLPLQAAVYSKAATRMYLLPSPSLEGRCFKHAPRCWGRLSVASGAVKRAEVYEYSREQEPPRLCTAPEQLLQALWRDELMIVARTVGHSFGKRFTREGLTHDLAESVPLSKLRDAVCAALMIRDWKKAGKRHRWADAPAKEAA